MGDEMKDRLADRQIKKFLYNLRQSTLSFIETRIYKNIMYV